MGLGAFCVYGRAVTGITPGERRRSRWLIAALTVAWMLSLVLVGLMWSWLSTDPHEPPPAGLLGFAVTMLVWPTAIAVTAARRGLRIAAAVYGLLALALPLFLLASMTGHAP
ncbi:MAG: hypothetical protein QOJ50_1740 [Cryptosporangiaceae bacterium]|nr:hypothetical protein [Cryptosporangiaceae bacterium]